MADPASSGPSNDPSNDRGERRGMDATLLARMTGKLGDRQTVSQKADALASALCEPFQAGIEETAGLAVGVAKAGVETGLMSDLDKAAGETSVSCSAAIDGWSRDIRMTLSGRFAVAFSEALLGGTGQAGATHPLSDIDVDLSIMLFEQVLSTLKAGIGMPGATATTGRPVAGQTGESDETVDDIHAVALTLDLSLGAITEPLRMLIAQSALLKTAIAPGKPARSDHVRRDPEWSRHLSRQVGRSDVTLQANVRLMPMTLAGISQMRAGDILPFADESDVRVLLRANGRDLYRCDLGKSGERYMVRLAAAQTLEDELVSDLVK